MWNIVIDEGNTFIDIDEGNSYIGIGKLAN